MKKVILEEVGRIREIMGFSALITEGIGDELVGMIGTLFSKADGEDLINNFVKSQRVTDGAGNQIKSWPELAEYAATIQKSVDDVVPGFTDDLFEYFLKGSSPENAKMFKNAASEAVFPSTMRKNLNVYLQGGMTKESAKVFEKDMITLADGIQNRYVKEAIEDTGYMKQIRGLEVKDFRKTGAKGNDEIRASYETFKQNSLKKDYEYTEADWKLLWDAKTRGIISPEEYVKMGNKELPSFGKLWSLYDNYKIAKNAGKTEAISFEEYLIELLKYKIPSQYTRFNVAAIKEFTNPFLAAIGQSKTMSIGSGWMWLMGYTSLGTVLTLLYHGLNIGSNVGEKITGAVGDVDYSLNAERRWKEYWEIGNSAAMKNLGDGNENIYSEPDTDVNLKYAEGTPGIEIINADENIVRVKGGKISLGGELYDKVYFRLGFELAGKDIGRMSPDVIEPIKSSSANAGASTPPNTQQPGQTRKEELKKQQEQGQLQTIDATDAEKVKIIDKLYEINPDGDYGKNDYPYIKKIDDEYFLYCVSDDCQKFLIIEM
jgi:hypothetical protein